MIEGRPMRAIYFILSSILVLLAPAAVAQGNFNAVITVNDTVITNYELNQRIQMLRVFRTPGDLNEVARKQLIEERLMDEAMFRAGIALTEEGMAVAMSDFAGRANLETEQFVALLAQNGVDRPTVEQFVRVGLTWRDYIRNRFGAQARITDAEVDRARAQMKAGMLMGLESPSNRAERLARLVQIWDVVPPLDDTVARIDAVSTGDVREFAETIASNAPAALALYGPIDSAPTLADLQGRRAA